MSAEPQKHWWVISPEFIVGGDNWEEPYEYGRDCVTVAAPNKRAAIIAGVKAMREGQGAYSARRNWPKHAREDNHNPYAGVTAEPAECVHGVCTCEIPGCEHQDDYCEKCDAEWQAEESRRTSASSPAQSGLQDGSAPK